VSKKLMLLLATVVVVVLSAAAAALASSPSHNNDSATKGALGKGELGKNKGFAGLVDLGGGRKMYMECQGKGRPTVVFVSGATDRAETWSETLDPSEQAVLPAIAETNRVCAYDRPGTILATGEGIGDFSPSRSDPVDQPTTMEDHAAASMWWLFFTSRTPFSWHCTGFWGSSFGGLQNYWLLPL
jgi:pimeloyl-ACP methyl ester carboxylesterase